MYRTLQEQDGKSLVRLAIDIRPIQLGREFYLVHHFHALREIRVDEYSDETRTVLLGMFATVECAAKTAVHGRFSEVERSWVEDTKVGYSYTYGQCLQLAKCLPDSIFAIGNPSISKTAAGV